ncbi:hypothetical protein [Halococcus sp. PRR34]|uniref:hypothetical protein n=1 Tax=Halococcus sp. PRR34 TaxID=3020830 RepID=UPI00235FAFA1|nr:hypothetical protein [Halococcus sp. PRR34]
MEEVLEVVTVSPLIAAGAVLIPVIFALGLARTTPHRRDLSLLPVSALTGFVALLSIILVPLFVNIYLAPVVDQETGVERLLFFLGQLIASWALFCWYVLPVATLTTGYLLATAQQSWKEILLIGTPAIAGFVWWIGLYFWRFWGTIPSIPYPLSILRTPVEGPAFTLLDLATLPTLIIALAYLGWEAKLRNTPTS